MSNYLDRHWTSDKIFENELNIWSVVTIMNYDRCTIGI